MADEANRQFAGLSDVSISEDIPVEGDIAVPMGSSSSNRQRGGEDEFSTLDEPVKETILRDLRVAVGSKFIHVLYPKRSSVLCCGTGTCGARCCCAVTLALLLQGGAADSEDQGGRSSLRGT
ncbi:hypothetical protein KUCAC02_034368 [Chaenocephalus aceratus]|nr:hypothetical protein KUCAC02_034368 [Chaenocephalus aceratus]